MLLRRYAKKEVEKEVKELKNFSDMKVTELKELAKEKGIVGFDNMKKAELLEVLEKSKGAE